MLQDLSYDTYLQKGGRFSLLDLAGILIQQTKFKYLTPAIVNLYDAADELNIDRVFDFGDFVFAAKINQYVTKQKYINIDNTSYINESCIMNEFIQRI